MEKELNMAEQLIKDIELVKDVIHNLQFSVKDVGVIEYLRDMSQGIEHDLSEKEELAHELIAQAEQEQIDFERQEYYGD